jgi:hypothetical protein
VDRPAEAEHIRELEALGYKVTLEPNTLPTAA